MDSRERLLQLCVRSMQERELMTQTHRDRLMHEIKEIDNQAEHDYLLNLHAKGTKFPHNEHNLFISYLLDLVDDFDLDQIAASAEGEFPDIDVDYLPPIQPYLKDEWAPKKFGRQNVCNIGNYTTFGLKSSIIDMARVHNHDRNEMLGLTKPLGKDGDGNELTLDSACEIHEELRNFLEDNPDVADAAKRIINRNRGRGKHAGGLVISSVKIDDFVPLTVDTNGHPVSAWTEGLHDQDLQPVGLIKFDVLVIKDLLRIAECVHMVKQRTGLKSMCALPDQSDWTDTAYLNDPDAIRVATEGDLKGVFQFGSKGLRELVRKGGVDSFNDLVAYTSLYRPGPLGMKMHERYIDRKRGREPDWENEIPDVVKPILTNTYGVMCYQEQVMQILNVVGKVPLIHCEKVRKAISKKDDEIFAKYRPQFITEGMKSLDWPEDRVADLWDQIVSFAAYGFNKSHAVAYTYISSRLLYLKAHYPREFYACTLRFETKDENVKEFKREAQDKGINVCRLDVNKSGLHWDLVEDDIYIGFSNVKGIGDEPAVEIVANQPYNGLEDFLVRYGHDAKVLKPLILLSRTFDEGDPAVLWEFYEHYKDKYKKVADRAKRNQKTRDKYIEQLRELMPSGGYDKWFEHDGIMKIAHKGEEFLDSLLQQSDEEYDLKTLWSIYKKYGKSVEGFEKKVVIDMENPVVFSDFDPCGEVDEDIKYLCDDERRAESKFYGFAWTHPLEDLDDYDEELMFIQFQDESLLVGPVQVQVVEKPKHKKSKKGHDLVYLAVEDAAGVQNQIMFFSDDYKRFQEELEFWDEESKCGHYFSIRVRPPNPPFRAYLFDTPSKQNRHRPPPLGVAKNKEDDHRLLVLKGPRSDEEIMNSLRNL